MYAGEGESILCETFRRARLASPAVVLFDEVDAIAGNCKQHNCQTIHTLGYSLQLVSKLCREGTDFDMDSQLLPSTPLS